jgi:hypothetical protein
MGQRIDRFCEDLRLKLSTIDTRFDNLQAQIDAGADRGEEVVHGQLEVVRGRIAADRARAQAAKAELESWAEQRRANASESIASWKAKRELEKLEHRADKAESYAAAAKVVALEAIDEAEGAALEAWLARRDAIAPQAA